MEKLKVASLFCGCGGTDVGMMGGFDFLGKHYAENGVKIVYANDFERSACNIFEANFGLKPDNRDIRDVKTDELPEFDILTGGFPCQSFSIVAQNPKRLGIKDEKGMLFFEMCRILRERKPKCFIAENVKGLLTANKNKAFPLIIKEFEDSGYDVKYKVVHDVDEKYFFSQKAIDGMMRNRESMNKGRAQNIDEPCNTVGAHLAKVSLNSTDPVLMVDNKYRRFTPREVARMQSFPESFKLTESEYAQYKALGNAIPPVMFWYIMRSVRNSLFRSV